jgi:hypothetical protein
MDHVGEHDHRLDQLLCRDQQIGHDLPGRVGGGIDQDVKA